MVLVNPSLVSNTIKTTIWVGITDSTRTKRLDSCRYDDKSMTTVRANVVGESIHRRLDLGGQSTQADAASLHTSTGKVFATRYP
jgi:hypothetical protein